MKKLSKILFVVFILTALMLPMLPVSVNAQSTIDAAAGAHAIDFPYQRKSFYANGRYWIFYGNGGQMCYRSSADGVTWSAKTNIRACGSGQWFSVTFDGTYVHYACYNEVGFPAPTGTLYYRMGMPGATGVITWSAAEQTVITPDVCSNVSIAADSNGYPWILYKNTGLNLQSVHSITKDGTWTMAAGDPLTVKAGADGWYGVIVALTGGKMLAVYANMNIAGTLKAKRYDSGWLGEVGSATTIPTSHASYFSVVAQSDAAHIVFLNNANSVIYVRYTINAFGAETTLLAGATATSAPVITRTIDDNNLHVFWENAPVDDHIYYDRYDTTVGAWLGVIDLENEAIVDGLPVTGYSLNSDYTCDSDYLGVYYIAGVSILKFKSLSSPFTVSTAAADAIGTNTATLNGSIDSLSFGAATSRGFLYGLTLEADTWSTSTPGSFGTGAFYDAISNLPPSTTFYFRAYATNGFGISYGSSLTFTTLAAGATGAVSSRAYIDITVAGNCTTDFAYLPLTITDIAHTDLIAAGYVNSSATDTRLTIFQSIFLSHLPVTDRLALVIPDFKALEVDTLRYYLGTDELQTDFDISVGYQGNITRIDTVAMRPGNNWQFDIKGFFDMSSGAVDKYVFYKPYEVQLYISAASTFTAQIGNGTDWIKTITVAGIGSGEHRVRTLSDGVDFQIYVDEVLGNSTATAAAINTAGSWLFMGNNSLCAAEYIKEDVPIGVQQLRYQPAALISGTTLIDEENGYDGNISWGTNPPCVDIVVGYIASNSFIPPVDVDNPQGYKSPETDIAGWFGICGNITGLPFYQTFHDAAEGNVTTGVQGMGMPVCSLYLMMMLGTASAVGLGLLVFTGSTVLAIIGVAVVITAGANTGVLSIWMTFVFALTAIAVVYISRQP